MKTGKIAPDYESDKTQPIDERRALEYLAGTFSGDPKTPCQDCASLRRQLAEKDELTMLVNEWPLFRAVAETLDGYAHRPEAKPDTAIIHEIWLRFTEWVRNAAKHADAIKRIESNAAALAAATENKSIETAPKDGSAILVYPYPIFGADQWGVAYWDRDEGYQAWRDLDGERIEDPPLTHRRPLPPEPGKEE